MSTWSYNGQAGPSTTDFATQTELDDAVATVNTALAAKQASSTAATDAELASAVSDLEALLADKADSGDVAADIAAAVSAHAAGDATDAELAAAVASLQPLDSDLTAIAALSTTSFGRLLLTAADAAGARDLIATSGRELGYAEITSAFTNSSGTTIGDVTGLSVDVTVGTRPIEVRFRCASVSNSGANGGTAVSIYEGATQLTTGRTLAPTATVLMHLGCDVRLAPSAGAHTYKVRIASINSGNSTISANTTLPAYIQVIEV